MKITFLPTNRVCHFTGKPSVLEVALENEIPINHSCGGMGSCTTCLVNIKKSKGDLPEPNELEIEHKMARGFLDHERLACQLTATDELVVEIPFNEQK